MGAAEQLHILGGSTGTIFDLYQPAKIIMGIVDVQVAWVGNAHQLTNCIVLIIGNKPESCSRGTVAGYLTMHIIGQVTAVGAIRDRGQSARTKRTFIVGQRYINIGALVVDGGDSVLGIVRVACLDIVGIRLAGLIAGGIVFEGRSTGFRTFKPVRITPAVILIGGNAIVRISDLDQTIHDVVGKFSNAVQPIDSPCHAAQLIVVVLGCGGCNGTGVTKLAVYYAAGEIIKAVILILVDLVAGIGEIAGKRLSVQRFFPLNISAEQGSIR